MSHFIWKCSQCGEEKSWDEFTKRRNPSGTIVPRNPCKKCRAKTQKEKREANPSRDKEIQKAFYDRNGGPSNYHRHRYQKNKDKMCAYNRKWYAKNQEGIKVRQAKYQKQHPELYVKHSAKRRARKKELLVEEVCPKKVFERDRGICQICHLPIEGRYHIDHIIPLSKGGLHSYSNVQLAHPTCNLKKGSKTNSSAL